MQDNEQRWGTLTGQGAPVQLDHFLSVCPGVLAKRAKHEAKQELAGTSQGGHTAPTRFHVCRVGEN